MYLHGRFKSVDYRGISYVRPSKRFSLISLGIGFQQQDLDYTNALSRKPCYKASNSKYVVDCNWWKSITSSGTPYGSRTTSKNPCARNIAIHRVHLIAARYKPKDNRFTFVYTNSFPQVGSVNSGSWNQYEQRMLR